MGEAARFFYERNDFMEQIIELLPLAEVGKGSVRIGKDFVEINVSGVNGGMKAWLIGGEAESIGNLVEGKLFKKIDTTKHSGILITQTGRQMFICEYKKKNKILTSEEKKADTKEDVPFLVDGFKWKKMIEKSYAHLSDELRFLLSNTSVYNNYRKHGHYWVGESEGSSALGLVYEKEEENPFRFIKGEKLYKNGYVIVCVDKKTGKLYIPE